MSNTVRVYELSRETGLANKEVLRRLAELDIEASSHSSSITLGDAQRFRESLGRRTTEDDEEERRRREEARRLAELDLSAVGAPERKKAAKVLPPHLRAQQEAQEQGEAAVAAAAAPTVEAPQPPAEPATAEPIEEPGPALAPEPQAPAARTSTAEPQAPAARMPGAPPPPAPAGEAPRPTPPGVRMPGAPPPPTVTGQVPRARRVVEPRLPQEGSGRRSIPPPVRAAPTRRPSEPGRGAPGRPAAPGRPSSPYRQPVGRGTPGTPTPSAPPAPGRGAPGGAPPGRGAPPRPAGKKRKKGRKTQPQEQALDFQPRQRRDEPLATDVERVEVLSGITVDELAKKLDLSGAALVKKLFQMGEMVTVQQSLPDDTVEILCDELGVDVYFATEQELEFGIEEPDDPADLEPRPPVVTVMGHVDHGKTLLLDAIREADVVSGEAGGITQHIGAYQVRKDGKQITFIDTPGHEAFTAMRARGAQITDIAVLVVAADDGVMPQTVEAINHAKAANVPIVVAVNKMDLPGADPDKVKGQLTEYGLIAEDYGGDTPTIQVSAKAKQGIDELLEILLLQADLMELSANPRKEARGRVVEAHLDKGRGAVATVLVQAGTLHVGDVVVAGVADGKVRAMFDEKGSPIHEAGPARPVQVLGWNDVPEAGDEFRVADEERVARDIAERRAERQRRKELVEQQRPKTLEDLAAEVERGEVARLNLIIKGDVSGSVEALDDALTQLDVSDLDGLVEVRVVHKGVGAVTANDVTLAEASDATIVAFNVRPDANAREAIERSGVDLRSYRIIYEAIEDIERALKGMLGPEVREVVLGEAEVREIFRVPRAGFVFGCMVTDGEVRRGSSVRVVREGVVVADDRVESLRRFKDDVREVSAGYECGIGLARFQDVKSGDVLEVYEAREVERV
ncbi:MAG: translation initiation factor IF-2 [Actinobacteria bacterium]|nr:translation initiation factor IF-2 [Actinomycetota bacterium]